MERVKLGAVGVILLICVSALAVTLYGGYRYRAYQRGIIEPLKEDLSSRTREAAARIEGALAPARQAADELARRLTEEGSISERELVAALRRTIESRDSFYGGTVAFEPFAFSAERRLFAPYFAKKNGGLDFLRIEDAVDYTQSGLEWYEKALAEGSRWSEPYFDTAIGDILMTTYSAVFREATGPGSAGKPRGVVTVDISMDEMREIVRSVELGGMGFAILLSGDGRFLYHPNPELVLSGVRVVEVARRTGDVGLTKLAEHVMQGGSGIADHTSPQTGLDSWFVYEPVPATGWSLVSVFVKNDIPIRTSVLRRWKMIIGAALVIFAISALALALRVMDGRKERLWAFSILASLALAAGIGYTWRVSLRYGDESQAEVFAKNDVAGLESFIDASIRRSQERLTEPPVFLPTGIFIDSMRFVSRTDVELHGYVWQKYDPVTHDGLDRGFLIAEVIRLKIGDPQLERVSETDVVRWPFETTVRVRFDYSKFPLMRERVAIRLVPRELSRSIVLVPDLEAYPILSPAARPGLDETVYLPGWEVTRTFFELREKTIDTDFGLGGTISKGRFPSLFFEIEVRKDFIDTFVANLIPLIIVSIVIFLVLMILSRNEDRIALLRTGTGFNLSICATLLFVTVLSHIGARQKIAAQEIIYLEYFYIVMYLAILWVAVNSIVLIVRPDFWFTRYRENLLPRTLFWPTTLGALWLLTLITFF